VLMRDLSHVLHLELAESLSRDRLCDSHSRSVSDRLGPQNGAFTVPPLSHEESEGRVAPRPYAHDFLRDWWQEVRVTA
jgi:hypothetical protein